MTMRWCWRGISSTRCGRSAPQVDPGLGELVKSGGSALGAPFIDALLGELAMLTERLVLVFEDLHVLTNSAVVEELGVLVTRLPPTTRCIVSTRRDPPWHLRQLRLDDRLVELRGTDLAFGAHEARQLLEAVAERDFTDDQVGTLLNRTDGWAVGLQLAAISLRDDPDVEASIDTFAGSDRLVAEYLLEEVLARQDPETRSSSSRPPCSTGSRSRLCDAVTGDDNARAMLDHLEKHSLFTIALDRSGELFRYHHLFADLLRYQLRLEDPTAARELHVSAAGWLLEHGRREEADGAPALRGGVPAGVRGGSGVRAPALRARRVRNAREVADRSSKPRTPIPRRSSE